MLVKEIMTEDVLFVRPDTTVYDAAELLVKNKVSGLPVLNAEDDVVGVVTEKDILVILDFLGVHQARDAKVSECMTKELVVCGTDTPVDEVGRLLVQRNIKRIPVVKEGKLVGILARRDILKSML